MWRTRCLRQWRTAHDQEGGKMLFGFLNRVAPTDQLKQFLDLSTQRTRLIADRVSKATLLYSSSR